MDISKGIRIFKYHTMTHQLKKFYFLLVFILTPIICFAQAETVFNNVHFEESLETVQEKVKEISEATRTISIDAPVFPLAKNKEDHLVGTNVKVPGGTIEKVIFTFADNKLTYIESRGKAVKSLIDTRTDTARAYLGYQVYFSDRVFAHVEKDAVWILTEAATHPNLFTWENPYLTSENSDPVSYKSSGKIPDFIEMGGNIDELAPNFEVESTLMNREDLDGSDPNAQIQINCFGIEYAGFPRKMEARFGDNKLNVVWILTGKGEEERIRQKLIANYGVPIFKNDDWEIYNDWQIGHRLDKPEVLLLTKELGQYYKKEYFKQ